MFCPAPALRAGGPRFRSRELTRIKRTRWPFDGLRLRAGRRVRIGSLTFVITCTITQEWTTGIISPLCRRRGWAIPPPYYSTHTCHFSQWIIFRHDPTGPILNAEVVSLDFFVRCMLLCSAMRCNTIHSLAKVRERSRSDDYFHAARQDLRETQGGLREGGEGARTWAHPEILGGRR